MRSWLFVPGDSESKIPKALAAGADIVILDLEDSVAPANKPAARSLVARTLAAPRAAKLFVRVNALDSGPIEADLDAVRDAGPDGYVLPKCENGADARRFGELCGRPFAAIATETAASLFGLGSYRDASPQLLGLTWGMEDLAAALGAKSNRDAGGAPTEPYRLARTLCLAGARAAGIEPIDAVYPNFRDLDGLEALCAEAARDGFTSKMCIHPHQVPIVNRAFTPSPEEIARAKRIVAAFAAREGTGVIGLDGEMLDVPHLKSAKALLVRAGS